MVTREVLVAEQAARERHLPLPGRVSRPAQEWSGADRGGAPLPAAVTGPVLFLDGVSRRFGEVLALDGVSLQVGRGEVLGIIGRSGAGKSTLIRCLNGLERPDSGKVEFEGQDLSRLGERGLQPLRRRIGMVFQHFNLLSARTVAQNVALPLRIAGVARGARAARVRELLELVGLPDKADAYPAQLSGGQKQRVGIARALAAGPSLLLCDEATSALDPETTRAILALLRDIRRRLGLSIVLITHEMSVVRAIADTVAVMEAGRIVERGPVDEVLAAPRHPLTRRLLAGTRPELPAALHERLRDRPHPGGRAVLQVDVRGAQAGRPFIACLFQQFGIPAALLHGGIEVVRDEPAGRLFLAVASQDAQAACRFLAPRVAAVEVLGHVAADA